MLGDVSAVLGIFQRLPERVLKALVLELHAANSQYISSAGSPKNPHVTT